MFSFSLLLPFSLFLSHHFLKESFVAVNFISSAPFFYGAPACYHVFAIENNPINILWYNGRERICLCAMIVISSLLFFSLSLAVVVYFSIQFIVVFMTTISGETKPAGSAKKRRMGKRRMRRGEEWERREEGVHIPIHFSPVDISLLLTEMKYENGGGGGRGGGGGGRVGGTWQHAAGTRNHRRYIARAQQQNNESKLLLKLLLGDGHGPQWQRSSTTAKLSLTDASPAVTLLPETV